MMAEETSALCRLLQQSGPRPARAAFQPPGEHCARVASRDPSLGPSTLWLGLRRGLDEEDPHEWSVSSTAWMSARVPRLPRSLLDARVCEVLEHHLRDDQAQPEGYVGVVAVALDDRVP